MVVAHRERQVKSMSTKVDIRTAGRAVVTQLAALRDEASSRAHLLSLDARWHWNRLDRQVTALEKRSTKAEGEISEVIEEAERLTRELTHFMATHMNHSVGLLTSARSLMTPTPKCRPDDSLALAAQLMREQSCGALPVVLCETVVGMLTDRDICMAAYTRDKPLSDLRVDSAMSKALVGCAPDDSIGAVLAILGDRHVRRLPVIDQNGTLLGIITLADVARWARSLANPAVDAALADTLGVLSSSCAQPAVGRA
jgi:CBS domain-containing protein